MFDLDDAALKGKILSCADGPASFNVELHKSGHGVVSVDPLYHYSKEEIDGRIQVAREIIVADTLKHLDDYRWDDISSVEELERRRLGSMALFLEDYEKGLSQGRYLPQSLPSLDFDERSFDLALCSHFLFTYSEQFSCSFHLDSILEMLRVANEVRIFPILNMDRRPSGHLGPILSGLGDSGYHAAVVKVPYEYQRGANQMLRVNRA